MSLDLGLLPDSMILREIVPIYNACGCLELELLQILPQRNECALERMADGVGLKPGSYNLGSLGGRYHYDLHKKEWGLKGTAKIHQDQFSACGKNSDS